MATLISYGSSGGDKGRCDAKCYDAQHPECRCICGGMNHGKGLSAAMENTTKLSDEWIQRYKAEHQGEQVTVDRPWHQSEMFAADAKRARTGGDTMKIGRQVFATTDLGRAFRIKTGPLAGRLGTVHRILSNPEIAWIDVHENIPDRMRNFPAGDSRQNHLRFYRDEVEPSR